MAMGFLLWVSWRKPIFYNWTTVYHEVFWCWGQNIMGELGQWHAYQCPGSLHRQVIIGHGIGYMGLTHWGPVTHICVSKLTIIGSHNGLSPGRCQAIIWNNAGILLIRTLVRNLREIISEFNSFSLKKMHFKMASAKWRLYNLGLNVLTGSCLSWSKCQQPAPS